MIFCQRYSFRSLCSFPFPQREITSFLVKTRQQIRARSLPYVFGFHLFKRVTEYILYFSSYFRIFPSKFEIASSHAQIERRANKPSPPLHHPLSLNRFQIRRTARTDPLEPPTTPTQAAPHHRPSS